MESIANISGFFDLLADSEAWLTRKESGEFNETGGGMQNTDADAFRHSYVSGIMTQIFSEPISEKMGLIVEWRGKTPEMQKPMDLWNNSIGRNVVFLDLFKDIKALLHNARTQVIRTVNSPMVTTYFESLKLIVEHEQKRKC